MLQMDSVETGNGGELGTARMFPLFFFYKAHLRAARYITRRRTLRQAAAGLGQNAAGWTVRCATATRTVLPLSASPIQMALRDSEAMRRLAVVVRDSRDAILVQDMTGRILAWNPGAERMYGWSEAEALAMNICDMLAESEREQVFAAVRQHCEAGDLQPLRLQRIAKDGRTVKVSIIVSSLVNEAGETYAIATTERVVTA